MKSAARSQIKVKIWLCRCDLATRIYPKQHDFDKTCHKNFPTFIAANKVLKQP